ncbi:MAG: XdhC/CoxI family protein [Bacteroidia bacterium]|nr:XdhC family protein [Bacteroidia bacterium]MCZ2277534.1 XdhC/CoxI family protein [Bacteroidia bacterium]
MDNIYRKLAEVRSKNQSVAVCTVVHTKGSTPRRIGAKMLVDTNGNIIGTIGGGEFEKAVIENALHQLAEGKHKLFRHDLVHQHGMCCGGTVDVFIEIIMKKNRLYVFGAGHTGQALVKYAHNFSFEIYLIDERKEYIRNCTIEEVNKLNLPYQQALQALPFDNSSYICIMTHSHPVDREILACCLNKPHAYLGMIGSRRKVEITKKKFIEAGIADYERIASVDMPMGIFIGAEGPDEIALSIVAKLISVKNKSLANISERQEPDEVNQIRL